MHVRIEPDSRECLCGPGPRRTPWLFVQLGGFMEGLTLEDPNTMIQELKQMKLSLPGRLIEL